MPLIKTCELQNVCAEGQYGPWIIKNGRRDCSEYEGLDKYELYGEGDDDDDDENTGCTEVTFNPNFN